MNDNSPFTVADRGKSQIDYLVKRLGEVQKAPLLQKGEAAECLAAATIVVLRDLELRIRTLEERVSDGQSKRADRHL